MSDGKALYGLPNYLPAKPASEDEVSTNKHINWLKEAFKSRSPSDHSKVKKLMDLTLYRRRKDINDGEDIQVLLGRYPWLSSGNEILCEFQRISAIDIDTNLSNFLSENGPQISTMAASVKTKSELYKSLQDGRDEYAAQCLMILAIVLLLNEDIDNFIGDEVPEPYVAPAFIKCNVANFLNERKFQIYVDGIHVCDREDFLGALKVYICMYYVFNLAYKSLEKTLTYFDCVILKVQPEISQKATNKCVIQLIAKLNGLKQKKSTKTKRKSKLKK